MKLHFTKMHGCGNDFVVLDGFSHPLPDLDNRELTQFLCDRHFGIGCDQLLTAEPPEKKGEAEARMRIYNADASQVEMCGNGIRCVAKFLRDRGHVKHHTIKIETMAGMIVPEILHSGDVRVNMGVPILNGPDIPMLLDGRVIEHPIRLPSSEDEFVITGVSMGNPHCIIFVDDLKGVDFERLGPQWSTHPIFPKGVNVEFVEVKSRDRVEVKVWERGAGPTLACGTGACAVSVASILTARTGRSVAVELPGGALHIAWEKDDGPVFMTGPAQTVYEGVIEI